MLYLLLIFIVKDTGEQAGEAARRAKTRRVPSTGASVPVEAGHITLPVCGCTHQPTRVTLPNLSFRGLCRHFITEAGLMRSLPMTVALNLQPLSPASSLGAGAEGSNPLSKSWSFWQPAPILKLPRAPKSHLTSINSGVVARSV